MLIKAHHPTNNSNHYTNLLSENPLENAKTIRFSIKERLKPTPYYEKYIISILAIGTKICEGDVLLQLPKKSMQSILTTGDTFITFSSLTSIQKPLNPHQFDYATYLEKHYIFHKTTTSFNQLISISKPVYSIYRMAHKIRLHINQKLMSYPFSKQQLTIINALLLGQRQDIDQELLSKYQNAGAIHILAVSGLHVGILLILINSILKPLLYVKKGRIIKLVLVILSLWCFAIIAGLSPSVLRAVTMFSFLAIGMHIRSKTSIYNALFISLFILVCFNPLLLFSVGFQLSYAAVFSIVWMQPSLAKIYRPRFLVDNILWNTITVTITAQLGILPLSLVYFHQFPLLFFIANLMIIPFLGIILGFGIAIIILAESGILTNWIVSIYGSCIDSMNYIVYWVSQQEDFILTHIPFSWRMLIITYLLLVVLVLFLKKHTLHKLYGFGISCILCIGVLIYEKKLRQDQQELVIFHTVQNTTIGVLQNEKLKIYSNDTVSTQTKKYVLDNYLTHHHARLDSIQKLKNAYKYREKSIVIIDHIGVYAIKGLQPDVILLSGSPKIHLDRLIDLLQPKQIVADASNYSSFLDQWEHTCIQRNIPFHRTDKKGAFLLR